MKEFSQNNIDYTAELDNKRKSRAIPVLLLILLLLFSVSSYVIGYHIGRSVDRSWFSGEIIDTINITSGNDRHLLPVGYQLDIRGQIFYTDGTPYAYGDVELHSNVQYATTDEIGYFEFNNIELGPHTIYVVKDGEILSKYNITTERSDHYGDVEIVGQEDGKYKIMIPIEVTIVDLVLEIDIDNSDRTMNILMNPVQPLQPGNPAETDVPYTPFIPRKTGPSGGTQESGSKGATGTTDSPDVSDELIKPGTPGDTEQPGLPETPTVPDKDEAPGAPGTSPDKPDISEVPTGPEKEIPDIPLNPSEPVSPPVNPKPDRSPGLIVSDETANMKKWTVLTSVDIFQERPGNTGVRTIDGKNVIAPGATGRYIFKVKNPEPYPVEYTISLAETDENYPKLPLQYRLGTGISGSKYTRNDAWKKASDTVLSSSLEAYGDEEFYTLEWKWASQGDAHDTLLGTQTGNEVYVLYIVIQAWFK